MTAPFETQFFFEGSGKQLYAVHYPAQDSSPQGLGLVICPALGHEADLSLRVLVDFARVAARAGIEVLRFDYTGCGDSEVEFEEATLSEWLEDIRVAVQALRRCRRSQGPLYLLGLRLGGTLTLLAAAGNQLAEGLILWVPVVTPRQFVDEMLLQQLMIHNLSGRTALKDRRELLARGNGTLELLGYSWKKETLGELEALDPSSLQQIAQLPLLLVDIRNSPHPSQELDNFHQKALHENKMVELVRVKHDAFWQTSNQPKIDILKWQHNELLFKETIRWLISQSANPRSGL